VTVEIVENDNVLRFQDLDEFGPDIGLERLGIDWALPAGNTA
jgi:hypothetical protein